MARPYVDYLIARKGPPPPAGLLYDYLLAGDGLWLAAEHHGLAIRAPVARAHVRGLPPLDGACILKHGPLPNAIWRECLQVARAFAEERREVLLLVILRHGGYELIIPGQVQTPSRVEYEKPILAPGEAIVLELHSHHVMPAFFSATDDADEQALAVYGVVGRLDRPVAEVILRAGAYGHTLPIPWSAVFAGDAGLIRDLANPAAGPHRPDGQTGERAEDYGEVPGERWAGGPGRIASGGLRDAFRRGVRAFARGGIR